MRKRIAGHTSIHERGSGSGSSISFESPAKAWAARLRTLLKKQKKMNKPEFPLIPRHSYKLDGLDESYLHLNQTLKIHYEDSMSSKQKQQKFPDSMTLSKTRPCGYSH